MPSVRHDSQSRVKKTTTIKKSVIAEDIEESFPEELKDLQRDNCQEAANVKMRSILSKLDPFIDSKGVLRVRGRLEQAHLSNAAKHPIILPSKNHATSLIIRYFHEKEKHQGKGITFNEIRANGSSAGPCLSAQQFYLVSLVVSYAEQLVSRRCPAYLKIVSNVARPSRIVASTTSVHL